MLQNARVTAFNMSELLTENQRGGKITPPRLGLIVLIVVIAMLIIYVNNKHFACFLCLSFNLTNMS